MYLSRVVIHDKRSLNNPYDWHRALWTLFPDMPQGDSSPFMYRIERMQLGRGAEVLLQSYQAPNDMSDCVRILASKELAPRFSEGQHLGFTLQANPTKKIKDAKDPERKVRVPFLKEEEQEAWLQRKFEGVAQLESVLIRTNPPTYFSKRRQGGKVVSVNFDGILRVTDAEQFSQILQTGIGPAKAFGCGLMLVRCV